MLAPLFLASLVRGHATLAKFDPRLVRHIRATANLPSWSAIYFDDIDDDTTVQMATREANDGCRSAAWLLKLYFPELDTENSLPGLTYKQNVQCGEGVDNAVGCFFGGRINFEENGVEKLGWPNFPAGLIQVEAGISAEYEFHVCLHELLHAFRFNSLFHNNIIEGNLINANNLCSLWKIEHGNAEEQPYARGHWSIDQNTATPRQKTGKHIYSTGNAGNDESDSIHELMTSVAIPSRSPGSDVVDDVMSYLSASTLLVINLNFPDAKRRWCFPIDGTPGIDEGTFGCGANQKCVALGDLAAGEDKRVEDSFDSEWNDVPGVCVYNNNNEVVTSDDSPGLVLDNTAENCNYAPDAILDAGNTGGGGGGGGGGGFIITSSALLPEGPLVFWTVLLAAGATTLAVVSVI
tara:strand:- start:69 stop:1289 length:1221 start_codon:yes stop_codon:yes gene_type:complete